MDGVLLDSEDAWFRAEVELMRQYGVELTADDRIATIGRSPEDSVASFAERLGWAADRRPELRAALFTLMHEAYRSVDVLPGARELVSRLSGVVPLGLASNTDRALVVSAVAAAGFDGTFDVVVSASDVPRPKPFPDLYLRACELLRVAPADAVALEDSGPGIAAAKAAGMTCIAVPLFPDVDATAADFKVASLDELVSGSPSPRHSAGHPSARDSAGHPSPRHSCGRPRKE